MGNNLKWKNKWYETRIHFHQLPQKKLSQESVETDVIFRDDSKIIQIARCDIFH